MSTKVSCLHHLWLELEPIITCDTAESHDLGMNVPTADKLDVSVVQCERSVSDIQVHPHKRIM